MKRFFESLEKGQESKKLYSIVEVRINLVLQEVYQVFTHLVKTRKIVIETWSGFGGCKY